VTAVGHQIDNRYLDRDQLEQLHRYQEAHASPTVDGLLLELSQKFPEWRLDRLSENASGEFFASVVHRTAIDWQLPPRVSAGGSSYMAALKSLLAQLRRKAAKK
jgi:hypothetical protein